MNAEDMTDEQIRRETLRIETRKMKRRHYDRTRRAAKKIAQTPIHHYYFPVRFEARATPERVHELLCQAIHDGDLHALKGLADVVDNINFRD